METNESIVPFVDNIRPSNESLVFGMYSSLMGTFDIPTPINYLGSTTVGKSIMIVFDRMDPWVLPSRYEPQVPLSAVEVAYQAIVDTTVDLISTPSTISEELKESYLPA